MKTNKLLQLIQQKKFMRSGGALPLPKAVTGNAGQCDPGEYWDPYLKKCVPGIAPTRSDSLAIYNNTVALNNFIKSQKQYKEVPVKKALQENISLNQAMIKTSNRVKANQQQNGTWDKKSNEKYNKNLKEFNERIAEAKKLASEIDSKKITSYLQNLEEARNRISDHPRIISKDSDYKYSSADYYKPVNDYQFYQRELSNGTLNVDTPMSLYDTRITPQYYSVWRNKDFTNVGRSKDFEDQIEIFGYDPLAVKPYDLRTPEEKIEWEEKYGNSTPPTNVNSFSINPIISENQYDGLDLLPEEETKVVQNDPIFMEGYDDIPAVTLPSIRMELNPKFDTAVDKLPNRTKEAVVDPLGNPRYIYYNGDKSITEGEFNKLQREGYRDGGSLPIHQWINSQVMAQPGPTQAKANFINSTALNMATQNSANILNQIMSDKKNQPFLNFVDTRVTDPVVPGKKLEATRKHDVKGVSREELMKMVNQAKKLNTDPSTAITTALWETNMGQTDPNLVHDLHAIAPTEEGLDDFDARANMAMQAINRQLNIGKRKYPGGPFYKQMQAFQGYGPLYPHTERGYYKHNNQAFFGIPVTQDNPLRTNVVFPYGKTIENFRDSVVIPTLDQYGIQYKEQGGLTRYQENGEVEEDYTEDQKREMAQWLSGQELYDLKEKLLRENQGLITNGDYGKYGRDYYLEEDSDFKKIPRTLSDGYEYNERLELIDRMQNPAIKSINRNVNAPYVNYPDVPETLEEAARFSNYNPRLKKDSSGLFPVQPFQESELKKGGLTKAQQGQTVSQLWKEVTGTDWSKAKEMGLTDGSYEKNMEVRNALSKYMQSQPQPKKESKPAAPVYPWSPGGKYAHKDNARLVVDKKPSTTQVPPSRINELVANAMNQNNPTPVDAIPNMNMKAVQDINNLNSKVVNRDDTKLAPKGSARATFQNALNTANEAVENTFGNAVWNPSAKILKLGYDMFVGAPAQSAINISNTVKGDRPIRNDEDIANLGWDAVMVAPYVGQGFRIGKNAFNTTRRFISYNAIDPVNYGAWEKFKAMPRTFIRNITDPAGRPIRVGEELANQYGNTTSALRPTREGLGPTDAITRLDNRVAADLMEKEMLGKRRLDAWNIYLQRPQKYNTFTKVGDNTYKINELDWDDNMFKGIVKDINAAKRGRKPLFATQSAYDPAYEWSQYRDDPTGIMGGFRFDVRPAKSKSGNVFIRSQDVWDVQPWGKRGTVYSDPNMVDQNELMKHYNKFLENFEVGKVLGGKPFTIENNFLFSPSQNRTLRAWEEGGELTSEKAIQILHDGTANGKPLTAAQKRYFTIIANKNKRNG